MELFHSSPQMTPAEEVLLHVVQRLTGLTDLEVAQILAEASVKAVEALQRSPIITLDDDGYPEWNPAAVADNVIQQIEARKEPPAGVN